MTPPARIGRFEIVRELGRGAMGVVYLAHDPRIDRSVAIKVIQRSPTLPSPESDEYRQRFLREAQAAGKLIHPGIVTIFDVGEDAGLSYIAMEYVEGATLESATKPGDLLPADTLVPLIIQACRALQYAHQHKVVHRDIKPANLMLVGGKTVKIMDFGLAKDPSANLTSAGTLIGTPNYMSPEQIMGKPLDGRSDLFSLGVVLYELLTAERPFGGDTISTIIYRILHEMPKSPDLVNPLVPPPLCRIIGKALEKDPAKRYQTGDELAAALQGYLDAASPQASAAARAGAASEAAPLPPTAPLPQTGAPRPARPQAQPPPARGVPKAAAVRPAPRPAAPPAGRRSPVLYVVIVLVVAVAGTAGVFHRQIADRLGLLVPPPDSEQVSQDAAGAPQADRAAAAGGLPVAPAPPDRPQVDLPVPLPEGEVVSIRVETSPPGGRIYLDDREVTGGTIVLAKNDRSAHALSAENECFRDTRAIRSGDPDSVVVSLKTPRLHPVRITSDPPGARILLNGRDAGAQTPADVNVTACEPQVFALKLAGYQDATRKFDDETVWASVSPVEFTLEKLPDGFVSVSAPYEVEVLEGGRSLGRATGRVKLPAGSHRLSFVNRGLFVEMTAEVEVPPDGTVTPRINFPGIGQLTVHANPSNGTVYVNGRSLGPPPIIGESLAEGTYRIKYVLDSGRTEERTVLVFAGQPRTEKFILK